MTLDETQEAVLADLERQRDDDSHNGDGWVSVVVNTVCEVAKNVQGHDAAAVVNQIHNDCLSELLMAVDDLPTTIENRERLQLLVDVVRARFMGKI